MKYDLDKISWADYEKKGSTKAVEPKAQRGFTKEKLLEIIQVAELSGIKMYIWVNCLQNYVRVYRNSITDCIHKCEHPDKITIRKEFREIYFK